MQRLKENNGQIKFCFFFFDLERLLSGRFRQKQWANAYKVCKIRNHSLTYFYFIFLFCNGNLKHWCAGIPAHWKYNTILAATWVKNSRVVEPAGHSIAWSLAFLGSNTASIDRNFSVLERKKSWKRGEKITDAYQDVFAGSKMRLGS